MRTPARRWAKPRSKSRCPFWLGLLALLTVTPRILAEEGRGQPSKELDTAREVAMEGLAAFDAGHYGEATLKLSRAFEVVQVPTLALYLARSLDKQDRLLEAIAYLETALALDVTHGDTETQAEAQQKAHTELDLLRREVPRLRVVLRGALFSEVETRVDGKTIEPTTLLAGLPLDPGEHELLVIRGETPRSSRFNLQRSRETTEFIVFPTAGAPPLLPPSPSPPSVPPSREEADARAGAAWQRPLGFSSLALGATGLLVGSVTGIWAATLYGTLEEHCTSGVCPPAYHDDLDTYRALRPTSTAALVAGGVGVALGTFLLLRHPGGSAEEALGVAVSGTSISLKGSF